MSPVGTPVPGAQRRDDAEAVLAGLEDEVLSALDAEQRETLNHLLTQATTSHAVDCASAGAEDPPDGGCQPMAS